MNQSTKPKIIVVVGQTSSGKSDLAVFLAEKLNGEVVSADSRQVYKGMDLGSGKITPAETHGIPHHLLNVISPKRNFSADKYREMATRAVNGIILRGKTPIVCGGTAFYIDALLYKNLLADFPPNAKLRKKLEKISNEKLFEKIKMSDPARANTIDKNNKRRLIRAIEIIEASGGRVPKNKKQLVFRPLFIGITRPTEEIKNRIHKRLIKRIKDGMLKEIADLKKSGVSSKRLDSFGLEYRYANRFLLGLIGKKEMIAAIERDSWHYAKRQITWWKKNKKIIWIKSSEEALKVAKKFAG